MTKAACVFLIRLREYVDEHSPQACDSLLRMIERSTGKRMGIVQLSRWLNLHVEPKFDVVLVLLRYAHQKGIIEAGSKKNGLFVYPSQKIETETQRAARVSKHLKAYAKAGRKK